MFGNNYEMLSLTASSSANELATTPAIVDEATYNRMQNRLADVMTNNRDLPVPLFPIGSPPLHRILKKVVMKVAESRITAPGVSLALHAGALLTVLLLGRTTVQFVPAEHQERG